jgi:glyoxalase family protein
VVGRRFDELGVNHAGIRERDGRAYLDFTDPEGQRLRLSEDRGEGVPGGVPWENSPVPQEAGIRGLGAVDLTVAELEPTAWVLTEVLGSGRRTKSRGAKAAPLRSRSARAARDDGPGGREAGRAVRAPRTGRRAPRRVQDARRRGARGLAGAHPAGRPRGDAADRPLLLPFDLLPRARRVLFEIATDGPGFATDEDAEHLGERLSLPPFLEGAARR